MRQSRGSTGKRRRGDDTPALFELSNAAPAAVAANGSHPHHHSSRAAHIRACSEDNEPPRRLSRHIPHRVGMDMELASYNLMDGCDGPAAGSVMMMAVGKGGGGASAAGADSHGGGGGDSFMSDDSTYMASLYKERLASSLVQGTAKIGGEVLRFGAERRVKASSGVLMTKQSHASNSQHMTARTKQRVFCPNPERVLDAPDLPKNASHMIDWGSNNRIAIGIRSSLYEYDPVNNEARKVVDLKPNDIIRSVHWLKRFSCVSLAMLNEPVAHFFDMRTEAFIRTIPVPGPVITNVAVNGSTTTIGNAGGFVYVYDLRSRDPLVATLEAHRDRVTALDYCLSDPGYLASGGTDGVVKVWDDRKRGFPVHTLDRVHQPNAAVTAILWNPDKRTTLFSGDSIGMLYLLDTHGEARSPPGDDALHVQREGCRGVNTGSSITGIVAAAGSGEVASAHRSPGHIQVRRVSTFQHVASFSSQSNVVEPIISMTLAPDRERVCAAQLDETLKFWKVFDDSASRSRRPECRRTKPTAMLEDELR